MRRYLALAMLLFAGMSASWCEDGLPESIPVTRRFPSALGAYGNTGLAGGISYQHWFGRFGLQCALGGLYQDPLQYDYNVQAGLLYMVYEDAFNDWFSGLLYVNGTIAHRGLPDWDSGIFKPIILGGAGIGMELIFLRHLSLTAECLYLVSYPLSVTISASGGIRYRF